MGHDGPATRQELLWLYKDIHSVVGEMMHVSGRARELKEFSIASKISSRAYELQGYANVLFGIERPQLEQLEDPEDDEQEDGARAMPF